MTDLSDILSCDQLDSMLKQQQQIVNSLSAARDKAFGETLKARGNVADAEKQYNDFNQKMKGQISEAQQILDNTPKYKPGKGVTPHNPDWDTNKAELDRLTARRDEVIKALQDKLDIEREAERQAKEKQQELENKLAEAIRFRDMLSDAARRCKPKRKSGLGGGILIGLGMGLSILGFGFLHSDHKTPGPDKAVHSEPAVGTTEQHNDSVVPATGAAKDDGPKTVKPAKKHIVDEPLGDEPRNPETPAAPKTDKTSNTDEYRDDDSSNVSTGDQTAVGNDDTTSDEPQTGDASQSYEYHYEVSDSRTGGDSQEPQRTDDEPQRTDDRPADR